MQIIAVDFDGTLCVNAWPEIGAENKSVCDYVRNRQRNGAKLILWTCRRDDMLDKAVQWCRERGIIFDAVNENLPEMIEKFGGDCRKVYADEYLDDKMVPLPMKRKSPDPGIVDLCKLLTKCTKN